jgi:hypothetical protein
MKNAPQGLKPSDSPPSMYGLKAVPFKKRNRSGIDRPHLQTPKIDNSGITVKISRTSQ